ncbi:hypothetical protein AADR41_20495 [Streptomyces sp. CLV115]|uniref:hypothetical protein n=1 Tax=Streptomyces sp. CLV115 TaxID=3138502 RepID=UPI00313B2630
MRSHRKAIQNPIVAKHMNRFFKGVTVHERKDPSLMAKAYARHLFHERRRELVDDKKLSHSPFYVGLGVSEGGFERLTKRSLLVSDTLLLAHHGPGSVHELVQIPPRIDPIERIFAPRRSTSFDPQTGITVTEWPDRLALVCDNIFTLGQWLTNSEPLLRSGLVWYLPKYSIQSERSVIHASPGDVSRTDSQASPVRTALDFLVRDGRVIEEVEGSGNGPVQSRVVRPILQMDLPFIDGVSMATASRITVEQFGSYRAAKRFLQQSIADLDGAVQSDHMEHELRKIGNQLEDEIRRVQSQMNIARRKRAISVTGAVIGTVGAVLVAVYGPAMTAALPLIGAAGAGGVWEIIRNTAENSPRTLRDDQWYYMWLMAKNSNTYTI